jgi:asparagine synthase (glutamine-hydrolysing)
MPCGICGFVGLSDKKLLAKMCESIRHRGPDHTGYFIDKGVGLGIDRLKIIDLVSGAQPIHNEDGSIWVVFNGEIYDYTKLRNELVKLGHVFYTESDTECIVHAYEQWGDECVTHLRGMFALAVWDSLKKKLYLARDRFGKKPLYYRLVEGIFLFGSEIKSILQYEPFKRKLNLQAMDYFFAFMYIPTPLSIFEGIQKFPPAHYGTYENGKLTLTQYWDFKIQPVEDPDEDAIIDQLYAKLKEAVNIRMRSDVPLGAFLSGGIDSSTVVSLMSKLSPIPVKTVSIGFNEEMSEVKYSRLVAEILHTEHHEYTVTPNVFEILPKLISYFDEPFADHSMIPTYYLSEVTRKQVTVALSGDGGDELFMGYPFLKDPRSYVLYSKVPSPIRKPALRAVRRLPFNKQFKRMANHAIEKDYGEQSFTQRFSMRVSMNDRKGLMSLYSRDLLSNHEPIDPYEYLSRLSNESCSSSDLDSADYTTVRSYLEEDILVKVDRMSMAVSLEVRCPLLDNELSALVQTIPANYKMRGFTTKYIFKKMAVQKGLVPKEIAYRKKQGFGAPIESWFQKEWKELTTQVLDPVVTKGYTKIFDQERVKSLMREPYVNSNKLFALIVFVIWYKMYIDGDMVKEICLKA